MKIKVTSPEQVGHWARQVRKQQKLDQTTAGSIAGSGITFVSQFENGKPSVQIGKVMELLDVLGIEIYLDIPDDVAHEQNNPI